jgi:hypothetical protein
VRRVLHGGAAGLCLHRHAAELTRRTEPGTPVVRFRK